MKKNNLILTFLLLLTATFSKAQIGTLTGKGMNVCADFSFSICAPQVITPLAYGTEGYRCDNMNNHTYISFNPQGSTWRVEELSWNFEPFGTNATVSGIDPSGATISHVFTPGQVLKPFAYTTIASIDYVTFYINNAAIGSGFTVKKANFQISLNAAAPSASFLLGISNSTLQGSSTFTGTQTWKVYSISSGISGAYTLVATYNTPTFTYNMTGTATCYYVTHTIVTPCGEICEAQIICETSCDEQSCNLTPPTGLNATRVGNQDKFTWNPVPGAVSYTLVIIPNDPKCCGGEAINDPIEIPNILTPDYIMSVDEDFPCYSWRVIAICPLGEASSEVRCSPSEERSSMGKRTLTSDDQTTLADKSAVNVYPNPTKGMISFEINTVKEEVCNITITDLAGKKLESFNNMKTKNNKLTVNWNTEALDQGEYLVKIVTLDNQTFVKKFIKE